MEKEKINQIKESFNPVTYWYQRNFEFIPTQKAQTKFSAWEKTFVKWFLIASHDLGYKELIKQKCGLCDVYLELAHTCESCPIFKDSKSLYCLGVYPYLELLNRTKSKISKIWKVEEEYTESELILQMIIYLCKLCKIDLEKKEETNEFKENIR